MKEAESLNRRQFTGTLTADLIFQALRQAAAEAYEDAARIAGNYQCSCIDPDAKCDGCNISHNIAAKSKALRGSK